MITATISENGRAALELAEQGYRVHPCRAGKEAYLEGWPERATTDEDKVTSWWQRWPDALVGVATGRGLVVVDVDGDEGAASLAALTERYGPLPPTRMVRTGGGGYHFWLAVPEGVETRNTASRIGEKIDTRGDGGYVISYGLHKSGRPYEADDTPVADAPAWLVDLITPRPVDRTAFVPAATSQNTTRYGSRALELETQKVATAPEGTRNHRLNEAAFALGQLEAGGEIAPGDARAALEQAARSANLGELEVRKTIESGLSAGSASPRTAPPRAPSLQAPRPSVASSNGRHEEPPADLYDDTAPALVSERSPIGESALAGEVDLGSWTMLDLVDHGQIVPEAPSILGLFYENERHLAFGPHSAGKTTTLCCAVHEVITTGRCALWIDTDGGNSGALLERLRLLGLSEQQLRKPANGGQFLYYRPGEKIGAQAQLAIAAEAKTHDVAIAIVDSSIGSFAREEADSNDATDVDDWWFNIGDKLRGTRGAVVMLDHTGVNAEAQGRPMGNARKVQAVACAFKITNVEGFGRGRTGRSRIVVKKDHPGFHPAIDATACEIVMISDPRTNAIRYRIEKPTVEEQDGPFRPTVLMDRTSSALEGAPGRTLTKADIKGLVKGKNSGLIKAFAALEREGHISIKPEGTTERLTLIRPYRKDSDPVLLVDRVDLYADETEPLA